MIKIAICDDDAYICSEIEKVILDFRKTSTVEMEIEVFYSGEELISFMEKGDSFDGELIF